MRNVYVVTSGSYSDYGINAIFSTRKAAQEYIDKVLKAKESDDDYNVANVYWSGDANIEVWPLDKEQDSRVFTYWSCGLLLDDGSMVEPIRSGKAFGHPESKVTQYNVKVPYYDNRPIVRVISVKSAKHAEKLAVEARQKWLREATQNKEKT